jgi:inosine-uridine nucleoside N-ribohydrolase
VDEAAKLLVLKQDLQMLTSANDDFLKTLMKLAASEIETEGITLTEGNIESDMAVIQYAAYLFRKRAGTDASMPRYLRWQLNNMLFSQKGKAT